MFRLKTVSSLLFYVAAILVSVVFLLHFFAPSSYQFPDNVVSRSDQQVPRFPFLPQGWFEDKLTTTVSIPAEPFREVSPPTVKCRENLITIEQYRSRSINRAVIVRFPSSESEYYFVQFRWFYRSWIESEMFTLDRWRTDIIVLIDDQFPNKTRASLEHLDCHFDNQRTSRRQISRCILVNHKLFSQRSQSERQSYIEKYPILSDTTELDGNIERLIAIYDYTNQVNNSKTIMYDFLMITTMNTFLTTQFGKYIPVKCAFLIGTSPDYSTWYGKTDQILQFVHNLLSTLKKSEENQKILLARYSSVIEKLQKIVLFTQGQVDIPCDSKQTTYRTSIYHLKCYSHSTSLFSEKMFREKAYDGYDKEPFNIYIAREYATLIALQSKSFSLDDLHSLAVNITRREIYN